jgi:Protein of unknown function (DUF726)
MPSTLSDPEKSNESKGITFSSEIVSLPSIDDRLLLYFAIERVVYAKIKCLKFLPDTRPTDWRGKVRKDEYPEASTVGLRGRQIAYLQLELLPLIAASLLLPMADMPSLSKDTKNSRLQDPTACVSFLLSNIMLLSKGNYDARIRHVVKATCIPFLIQDIDDEQAFDTSAQSLYFIATKEKKRDNEEEEDEEMQIKNFAATLPITSNRVAKERFEQLETTVATDILEYLVTRELQKGDETAEKDKGSVRNRSRRQIIVRSLQITSVTLVVGGLFAVTGGIAAPALVAAMSALGAATLPAFATLTTHAALMSMFGVMGGGLTAYKMKKRTDGLREWRIRKETTTESKIHGLFATVCVSGWLRSKQDFQTPFGITANDPPCENRLELLQRFFSVKAPDKLQYCKTLLKANKNSENNLWARLKDKYGCDPNHLLPFPKPSRNHFDTVSLFNIKSMLTSHVFEEGSAKKLENLWEANLMLQQMEKMNAEIFSQMNEETLDVIYQWNVTDNRSTINLNQATPDSVENLVGNLDDTVVTSPKVMNNSIPEWDTKQVVVQLDHDNDFLELDAYHQKDNMVNSLPPRNKFDESNNPQAEVSTVETGDKIEGILQESECLSTKTLDDGVKIDLSSISNESRTVCVDSVSKMIPCSLESTPTNSDKLPVEDIDKEHASPQDFKSEGCETIESSNEYAKFLSDPDYSLLVWDWEANYSGELYTITWEPSLLLKLCKVIEVLFLEVTSQISKEVLKRMLLHGLSIAVALPSALTTATGVIDDPYQLIAFRSEKAGVELACCLLESDEHRPVSLIGYSFGARIIFCCLLELIRHQAIWEEQNQSKKSNHDDEYKDEERLDEGWIARRIRKNRHKAESSIAYKREPASIVEDVILIGMPMLIDNKDWIACRELASGRVINCYNKSDWILSYMINIRCWNGMSKTCGTYPILGIEGVENFEVSHLATSHSRYPLAIPHILHEVGYGEPILPTNKGEKS